LNLIASEPTFPACHRDRQFQVERDQAGLRCIQGKAVNSISMKRPGHLQAQAVAQRYGAAVVMV
jgi:cobalamin-dependent methionine synthase I